MYTEGRRQAEFAYDKLIAMIAAGALKPGMRLATAPLAEELGVSRTPVIEALKKMQAEGIVVFKTSNGAWLIDPTKQEIGGVYEVRATLECLALEHSFPHITQPALIGLRRHAALEREYYATEDRVNFLKSGLDFHRDLAECCHNRYLVSCIHNALATTFAYVLLLEFRGGNSRGLEQSLSAHDALLDMIASGDKEGALAALHANLMGAFAKIFQGLPE